MKGSENDPKSTFCHPPSVVVTLVSHRPAGIGSHQPIFPISSCLYPPICQKKFRRVQILVHHSCVSDLYSMHNLYLHNLYQCTICLFCNVKLFPVFLEPVWNHQTTCKKIPDQSVRAQKFTFHPIQILALVGWMFYTNLWMENLPLVCQFSEPFSLPNQGFGWTSLATCDNCYFSFKFFDFEHWNVFLFHVLNGGADTRYSTKLWFNQLATSFLPVLPSTAWFRSQTPFFLLLFRWNKGATVLPSCIALSSSWIFCSSLRLFCSLSFFFFPSFIQHREQNNPRMAVR